MTEKTVGYVELEWTCKRCGTKNPGTQKACSNCGAVMSDAEQFGLPAGPELLDEKEALAKAGSGPDVHCAFCGARNPAGASACTQCGADLKSGKQREAGQVLGSYQAGAVPAVPCPACGSPNTAGAPRCAQCGAALSPAISPAAPAQPAARSGSRKGLVIAVAVAIVACIGLAWIISLGARKQDLTAQVQSVEWQRSIQVLEEHAVERQEWKEALPAGVDVGACEMRYHHTQAQPAPNAEEVCGTAYTKDLGNGMGQVVQDCEYRVEAEWCTYSAQEWVVVDRAVTQGSDLRPAWPSLSLGALQREGDRSEDYSVVFDAGRDTYTYSVSDPQEFAQFTPGSEWTLKVNGFGAITAVEPR